MLAKDKLVGEWASAKTTDPEEVARFNRLAEEWWDPKGKFRPIHKFNPVRRDYIISRVANHFGRRLDRVDNLSRLSILDVGCGAGLLCEPLAMKGARVVGIDAAVRNIEVARWHAAQSEVSVDYRHCLAEQLVETDERFDVVLNTEVVEHVADVDRLLTDCAQLVKPGGLMIVGTLNRTVRSFVLAIVGAEYILRWLPKGTHDWRRFLQPKEISTPLHRYGLETQETVGVVYSPFSDEWRLSDNTSANYLLTAEKSQNAQPDRLV